MHNRGVVIVASGRRGPRHGVAASQSRCASQLKPTPNPSPALSPAHAAACADCAARLVAPPACSVQVHVWATREAAARAFFFELGNDLGRHRGLRAQPRSEPCRGAAAEAAAGSDGVAIAFWRACWPGLGGGG